MLIYAQLFSAVALQIALSVGLYLIKKKKNFWGLSEKLQQVLVGVLFGLAAVYATEFGVTMFGATMNVRDAAPLCAGLLFGGPAGIIAGLIGGVERWFATYWGAGDYSQLACSISTIIAGIYAAVLRKYMFDNKRPTPGFGFVSGVVMEIAHLTILFLTHPTDPQQAFVIVKACTLPMVLLNGFTVAAASTALLLICKELHDGKKHLISLAQKVQSAMLVCVCMAYFFSTFFVYVIQTNTAKKEVETLLLLNISDVQEDILQDSDEHLLIITRDIADAINSLQDGDSKYYDSVEEQGFQVDETFLKLLRDSFEVAEINIVNGKGIITHSTNSEFVGFDMNSGAQSAEFMILTQGKSSFVQPFQNISYAETDSSYARKYAGYVLKKGGFVQVGYDEETFHKDFASQIRQISTNRHIGESGFVVIADMEQRIINSRSNDENKLLSEVGIRIDDTTSPDTVYNSVVYDTDVFYSYEECEQYYIIVAYSKSEAFFERDKTVYLNSYMEILIFALLFVVIYILLKILVVNNIRSVNEKLNAIIGGNLDTTVDVRSSKEFASLSDDINSTVTTLKHYIEEAAARIDKELEFAKSIQSSSLPSKFPPFPQLKEIDIFASMCPAKEVGGDFYDFYLLEDNKVAFLMADVSGKGIPAAMFMMQSKTMLKNLAEEGHPVNEIMTLANERLCEGNDAGMFVTAFMCILDMKTGHVTFANAGHNPPLVYRKGEGFSYLRSRAGFVLAGMEGVRYKLQELDLAPGDRIFLYTDGVTEATDLNNELYGEQRLIEYMNSHTDYSAEAMLKHIKKDVDAFVGEAEQFDDMTMLMLDYFGKGDNISMTEKVFPAKVEALADVNLFLENELAKADCGMKTAMQVSVALEELFVNIANYAYPDGEGTATVGISTDDGMVTVQLTDSGVQFDPLAKADPDVTMSAEEREIGGLGIYMVKKSMDNVTYEYRDGQNRITFMKRM